MASGPIVLDSGLALTFDDVLLVPGPSEVMPGQVEVMTKLTKSIRLNIPLLSSAMDTVTEARLAIAMAQEGGIGVIHRNLSIEEQARHVAQVKRYESGIVLNPVTIHPRHDPARRARSDGREGHHRRSGRGDQDGGRQARRHSDQPRRALCHQSRSARLRADDQGQARHREARPSAQAEAKKLLHQNRIEKLIVVDDDYRCIGLITVKDIEKAAKHPNACKDDQGRLRVAAATTVGEDGHDRTEALIAAGCDVIVVDTAHGHSARVIDAVARIKKQSNSVQVIAGNVATADATKALIDAGADAIKVGIGPGSICTTRIVAGVGVPQLTAVMECAKEAARSGVPVIADGGIRYSGDISKAIAAGANLRHGRIAAGRHR